MAIVKELFGAYMNNGLPSEGGYIFCSFFDPRSTYTRYEIIAYNNVKDIYLKDTLLTFLADGKRLYVLVEPANYPKKFTEPSLRDDAHRIPYRFKEVEIYVSKRQDRIMIGKKPIISYTSFTVLKPYGHDFSYIFFETSDLLEIFERFFADSLWKDANVPKYDADKASKIIRKAFENLVAYKVH